MSPVSLSVPVGSVRQDDILTRDLQPRVPRGMFTTSANKDVHTHTAVCTCTLRAHLYGLDVILIVCSPRIMLLMTPKPAVERSLESGIGLQQTQVEREKRRFNMQEESNPRLHWANYDVGVHAGVTIKPAAAGAPFLPYGPEPPCFHLHMKRCQVKTIKETSFFVAENERSRKAPASVST